MTNTNLPMVENPRPHSSPEPFRRRRLVETPGLSIIFEKSEKDFCPTEDCSMLSLPDSSVSSVTLAVFTESSSSCSTDLSGNFGGSEKGLLGAAHPNHGKQSDECLQHTGSFGLRRIDVRPSNEAFDFTDRINVSQNALGDEVETRKTKEHNEVDLTGSAYSEQKQDNINKERNTYLKTGSQIVDIALEYPYHNCVPIHLESRSLDSSMEDGNGCSTQNITNPAEKEPIYQDITMSKTVHWDDENLQTVLNVNEIENTPTTINCFEYTSTADRKYTNETLRPSENLEEGTKASDFVEQKLPAKYFPVDKFPEITKAKCPSVALESRRLTDVIEELCSGGFKNNNSETVLADTDSSSRACGHARQNIEAETSNSTAMSYNIVSKYSRCSLATATQNEEPPFTAIEKLVNDERKLLLEENDFRFNNGDNGSVTDLGDQSIRQERLQKLRKLKSLLDFQRKKSQNKDKDNNKMQSTKDSRKDINSKLISKESGMNDLVKSETVTNASKQTTNEEKIEQYHSKIRCIFEEVKSQGSTEKAEIPPETGESKPHEECRCQSKKHNDMKGITGRFTLRSRYEKSLNKKSELIISNCGKKENIVEKIGPRPVSTIEVYPIENETTKSPTTELCTLPPEMSTKHLNLNEDVHSVHCWKGIVNNKDKKGDDVSLWNTHDACKMFDDDLWEMYMSVEKSDSGNVHVDIPNTFTEKPPDCVKEVPENEEYQGISPEDEIENLIFFRHLAAERRDKFSYHRKIDNPRNADKKMNERREPLSPISSKTPKTPTSSSPLDNLRFFKGIATNPSFYKRENLPVEIKRYIPQKPLNAISAVRIPEIVSNCNTKNAHDLQNSIKPSAKTLMLEKSSSESAEEIMGRIPCFENETVDLPKQTTRMDFKEIQNQSHVTASFQKRKDEDTPETKRKYKYIDAETAADNLIFFRSVARSINFYKTSQNSQECESGKTHVDDKISDNFDSTI